MSKDVNKQAGDVSRRDFIKTSTAASMAVLLSGTSHVYAGGSDVIRVGLIGCGGRGTDAARNCFDSSENIEVVALGDLVPDRVESCLGTLKRRLGDSCKVTPGTCFTGFNAFKDVIASDIDMVILATPPGFRPEHLAAAVDAGKHVFTEKPVAVDPVGIRSVIASAEKAKEKGLAIVAGTQRRHQKHYLEVMKRLQDGAIGDVVGGQCYWNQGGLWVKEKEPGMSDMEWMCRNWLYFTWLSGDHIVEQHVHNIDVINWAIGTHPVKCMGMGGREVRVQPKYGNIFDHFAIEFEYPNGVRVMSMCRQTPGCANRQSEQIVGTKGMIRTDSSNGYIDGANPYRASESPNPYVVEHTDLIASIRSGDVLNEGRQVAESTMCAIMGRMSAYTGKEFSWDWVMKASELDLRPPKYDFVEMKMAPVSVPGVTKLV
ncbi:MAG: Gfo/Idh/MocA family oxidoreductase [Planctomycetes bacterium]|nr:Gfo/Idh/MocA family oxidoreductase [Planctomycetota bacterium]